MRYCSGLHLKIQYAIVMLWSNVLLCGGPPRGVDRCPHQ